MVTNKEKALALTKLGVAVFPIAAGAKTPQGGTNGHLEATLDTKQVTKWWAKTPHAPIGVNAGMSGLCILDIDIKAEVNGWDSLEDAWVDVPATFGYVSSGGQGEHRVYSAPEGLNLNGTTNYRHMTGVDRRAGSSYVVWAGDVPASRDEFTPAPEWLLDEAQVRSAAAFTGTVLEWYGTLEPGDPNVLVRAAIDRVLALGDDFSHNEMTERQHEAVRLGAEGNPGVPELLGVLEEATLNRTGAHTRTPEEFAHEFTEALASGIKKYGEAISLRQDMPEYHFSLVPPLIPDRLVIGPPGDRGTFSELLSQLLRYVDDDYSILSILWSAPTTTELAHEWGVEFVYKRILEARKKPETPGLERPDLTPSVAKETVALLTPEESQRVAEHPTFIDEYLAATEQKGFVNQYYARASAWLLLSMALGHRAILPTGKPFGVNLWFMMLGTSGSGKSSELRFLQGCLDAVIRDDVSHYNLGTKSSPEGMHEALLERDGLPSMVLGDESSGFFESLRSKEWMSSIPDALSDWYDGYVAPAQKVRLKENKGRSATTSLSLGMFATPDRLLGLVDSSMFQSGFLARMNWVWAPPPEDEDVRYETNFTDTIKYGIHPATTPLVADLIELRVHLPEDVTRMKVTEEARKRLVKAHKAMDSYAKNQDRYEVTEPSVTRFGRETTWKCAALLALHRGSETIELIDALTSIGYVQEWFDTLFRVVGAAGEGDFNRDADQIEMYIGSHSNGVLRKTLYNRFRSMIVKSPRELDDRITFLITSGRVRAEAVERDIKYHVNG